MTSTSVARADRPRVLSGIQANGNLHIGNLIGALRQWAGMLDEIDGFFCIADLHALTIPSQVIGSDLADAVTEVAAWYVAAGIDPDKAAIFAQSAVPQHAELAWVMTCFTPMGWLERMTQFKAKSGTEKESVGAGLFTYPALQAADILLYQANYVPVGDDQRQHIELTRDVAQRFNHLVGEVFTLPEGMVPKTGARVMGLDDPTEKMSKSVAAVRSGHAVLLADPPDLVVRKLKSAQTDSGREVDPENMSEGVANLVDIAASLLGRDGRELAGEWAGIGYADLKTRVADVVVDALRPVQAKHAELRSDPAVMQGVLEDGRKRAAAVAEQTMARVAGALKMRRPG